MIRFSSKSDYTIVWSMTEPIGFYPKVIFEEKWTYLVLALQYRVYLSICVGNSVTLHVYTPLYGWWRTPNECRQPCYQPESFMPQPCSLVKPCILECAAYTLRCCVWRVFGARLINFLQTWGEQRTPDASSSLCACARKRQILVCGEW